MTRPQHGEIVRFGDEFNNEPWYMCDQCSTVHGRDYPGCDGLRRFFFPESAAAPKHQPQGAKMDWTPADESRFTEMTARRALVLGARKEKLARVFKKFPVDGIMDHMIEHLIANADEIRDALLPFDSGVRVAQPDKK